MTQWKPSILLVLLLGPLAAQEPPPGRVGPQAGGGALLPVGQGLDPAGRQVPLPGLRPVVLGLAPEGRLLVTSGLTHELWVLDPATGETRQRVALAPEPGRAPKAPSENLLDPDPSARPQASCTGLVFSADGRRLFLSDVQGCVQTFDVDAAGRVSVAAPIALPEVAGLRRRQEVPAGLALSADGRRLYVALSLSNGLGEFDAASGRLLRRFETGVAPYGVALAEGKAYVSNWGGRRPGPGDVAGPAGRGTTVRIDARTGAAAEGSVTVIDLGRGRGRAEVLTGRHASALALAPGGRFLVCANAGDDTLSVLDTRRDRVVETIWARPGPADPFGASPNALAFDASGRTLFVANGTQNAVAVVRFDPARRRSKLAGMAPVGWFPAALVHDAGRGQLAVANLKALPAAPESAGKKHGEGFNSRQFGGSLTLLPVPADPDLPGLTARVEAGLRRERIRAAMLPARPGQPPRPVPERIGEPSVFKHVVYVIKENRTYDQVLGDVAAGRGDPSLCIFGEAVTPNQHKLVREFALLDNTYCSGILSADGHNWSTAAFATDYLEKSFGGWPRSYPDGMSEDEVDALAYAPTGFLWDQALKHGKTFRDYGEFAMPKVRWRDPARPGKPDWSACWRTYQGLADEVVIGSEPSLEALRPHLAAHTVGWSPEVPDVWKARLFIEELQAFEQAGRFPELVIIGLTNDHTSGTKAGCPTPAATVADNDLAFGRIVEALSRSAFWKDTVVFAIEDDPQNGWDHVSGYRTTAYVVSAYTRRGAVVSDFYTTTSILRTIEQILGLPPMNQFDASAPVMAACFTEQPDFTPFTAVPNRVPLDQMNPEPKRLRDPLLKQHAVQSGRLDFSKPDACPEGLLNRILWTAVKGSSAPFPAWAVAAEGD